MRNSWEIPAPELSGLGKGRRRPLVMVSVCGLVETVVMNEEEDSVEKVLDVETDKEERKEEKDDGKVGVGKEGDRERR